MRTKKVNIRLQDLKKIVDRYEKATPATTHLSETLELQVIEKSDTHLGSDLIEVSIKSIYAECNSSYITTILKT